MGQKGNSVRDDQAGIEDLLEFLREGRILNRIAQNPRHKEMRGLSITNNLEVLQERLINAIARKRARQNNTGSEGLSLGSIG